MDAEMIIGIVCSALFFGFIVFAAVAKAVDVARRRKSLGSQSDALRAFANERGWQYTASDPTHLSVVDLRHLLPDAEGRATRTGAAPVGPSNAGNFNLLDLCDVGEAAQAEHVITGRRNQRDFAIFQLSRQVDRDEAVRIRKAGGFANRQAGKRWEHSQVVAIQLPQALPFLLAAYQIPGHSARELGFPEFGVGDESFAAHYRVHAESEAYARDVMSADVTAWLLNPKVEQLTQFVINGNWCFSVTYDYLNEANVERRLDALDGFVSRFPPTTWGHRDG